MYVANFLTSKAISDRILQNMRDFLSAPQDQYYQFKLLRAVCIVSSPIQSAFVNSDTVY